MNTSSHFPPTSSPVQASSEILSVNVQNSINRFGHIEEKLFTLDLPTVDGLVGLVETSILNNQQRLLGFQCAKTSFANRRDSICSEIRKETAYLAGTILPKLYERQEELVSDC